MVRSHQFSKGHDGTIERADGALCSRESDLIAPLDQGLLAVAAKSGTISTGLGEALFHYVDSCQRAGMQVEQVVIRLKRELAANPLLHWDRVNDKLFEHIVSLCIARYFRDDVQAVR